MQISREAPLRFLKAAFLPDDWIAVLLKRHDTGEAIQRVGPLDMALSPRFQSWLRFKNAHGFSVFVSVNALTPGLRSRTRESVRTVRHVFLDADRDSDRILSTIAERPDLPPPSFVIRSSAGRAHVLWRVTGMSIRPAEALQKHLARELNTDTAATSAAQLTRLPGFLNRKYSPPALVTTDRDGAPTSYGINSFPDLPVASEVATPCRAPRCGPSMIERARRYVAATPPAVEGWQGDSATFRLCCRLLDRFGLSDAEALSLLQAWNAGCRPPWTLRDLAVKVRSARRHAAGSIETSAMEQPE
ncbi:DNA-primase RepB domain-containing protein [Luteitalea sp.]